MNISKINPTSFKGYLTISDKNDSHCFNTETISRIAEIKDMKETRIYGKEFDGRSDYYYLAIPYKVFSPNKVMAAYSAACQTRNGEIMLVNKKGLCETRV